MLPNADGGGVSTFPKKAFSKVQDSTLLALQGSVLGHNFQKKRYATLEWPLIKDYIKSWPYLLERVCLSGVGRQSPVEMRHPVLHPSEHLAELRPLRLETTQFLRSHRGLVLDDTGQVRESGVRRRVALTRRSVDLRRHRVEEGVMTLKVSKELLRTE